jgi:hypothetical protein
MNPLAEIERQKMKRQLLIIAWLCATTLVGCHKQVASATNPDLLPVSDPRPGFGFAVTEKLPDGGLGLVITVKNRGATDGRATTTTVEFTNQTVDLPTPGIAAGASEILHVPFPSSCFQPDCGFVISVDSKQQINETDETNNKGSGIIIG